MAERLYVSDPDHELMVIIAEVETAMRDTFSEEPILLEIATRILHLSRVQHLNPELNRIADELTELGTTILPEPR